MKPAFLSNEAIEELRANIAYYEDRQPGLGAAFQAEVESAVWLIRCDPLIRPIFRNTGARRCLLKRFPFNVFYYDQQEIIWVIAIAHQRRQPGYWLNRQSES